MGNKEIDRIKNKYTDANVLFDNNDLNDSKLSSQDKNNGWFYPLTKTEQKKEYGFVAAEQQRFLWRLQDGHLDIVEDYLDNPKKKQAIDVNAYDEQGWTPIHYAAQMNYADIVKALLKGNANPSLKDKVMGMDALAVAYNGIDEASGPSIDVIEILQGAASTGLAQISEYE